MAAFGIPQAHEDDAERAVRAGLAILDAVEELKLEARVGVESGEVVADDAEATFATGEAVTLAARLEQAAEPGQLLIGPAAHRLTLGRVEVEELGPVELKGIAQPLWAWRATGTSRPGGVRPRTLQAPLVGRDAELELLSNTYDRALRDRRAHLFTIYGEPGVGKSRLAREFVEGARGRNRPPGPQPALRRGRHLLAARRDGQVRGRDRRRRPARRRDREAARLLRGRGRGRPARARLGGARGGAVAVERAGDRLGRPRVGPAARAGAAARARLRGHPLGRGAAARADRAPGDLGARGAAAARLPRAARAARPAPRLGRGPRARDRNRARGAAARRERTARRGAARERRAERPGAGRSCSTRPRATRSTSRRPCACWRRRGSSRSTGSRTRCRR